MVAITFSCGNPFKMVYTNGTELAIQQESLLVKYNRGDTISKNELRELKINWWVKTAEKLAPCNLVIRQYALIDLFSKEPKNSKAILNQVKILTGNTSDTLKTWLESYSYFEYTLQALIPWIIKYADSVDAQLVTKYIEQTINGFCITSYRRSDGLYYPAPFGDLFDIPLSPSYQFKADSLFDYKRILVNNVYKFYDSGQPIYSIYARPIGMNGHCATESAIYIIMNDKPNGFKYYEGYDKKYQTAKAEWKDLLNIKRLITIPFIW